ncbi:MAG: hypothetical protein K6T80_05635 [Firmicutes bacterium]|nr:hypothetical protein [Bacillota bacterium]
MLIESFNSSVDGEKEKSELTCDCGREHERLADLVLSLDDAGFKLYCRECPANRFLLSRERPVVPYV